MFNNEGSLMYHHHHFRYFHDGLKTIENFGTYIEDLVNNLAIIRQNSFEEKRDLEDVRNMLKTSPGFNKMVSPKKNQAPLKMKKGLHKIPIRGRGEPNGFFMTRFLFSILSSNTRSLQTRHLWTLPFKGWTKWGNDLSQAPISPLWILLSRSLK